MNNKVLFIHPTLGNITLNDLLNDLNLALDDVKQFEDIVYNILKDAMDEEDLTTLFNFSIIGRLEWIISILKQLL